MIALIAFAVGGVCLLAAIFPGSTAVGIILAKRTKTLDGIAAQAKTETNQTRITYFDLRNPQFGPIHIFMSSRETRTCDEVFDSCFASLDAKNSANGYNNSWDPYRNWIEGVDYDMSDFEGVELPDKTVTVTKVCGPGRGTSAAFTIVADVGYNAIKSDAADKFYPIIEPGLNGKSCYPGGTDPYGGAPNCPDAVAPAFAYDINCPAAVGIWGIDEEIVHRSTQTANNAWDAVKLDDDIPWDNPDKRRQSWTANSIEITIGLIVFGTIALIAGCVLASLAGSSTEASQTEMLNQA